MNATRTLDNVKTRIRPGPKSKIRPLEWKRFQQRMTGQSEQKVGRLFLARAYSCAWESSVAKQNSRVLGTSRAMRVSADRKPLFQPAEDHNAEDVPSRDQQGTVRGPLPVTICKHR